MRQNFGLTEYAYADNCRNGEFVKEVQMVETIKTIQKRLEMGASSNGFSVWLDKDNKATGLS